jgi:shikimate dehydrogenase
MPSVRDRAAVIGSPVAHSLSPVLHLGAYAALGLPWGYERVECDVAGLPATLDRLASTHVGLSVTMPLKSAVVPLLDEVVGVGARLGAVNTVVLTDGRRVGHNTDVTGVRAGLDALGLTGPDVLAGLRVVVLGAGGAARAVLAGLADSGCTAVEVLARDPARAGRLTGLGPDVTVRPWAAPGPADLLVSAVPAAASAELDMTGCRYVFDLAYGTEPTPLMGAARRAGAEAVDGLPMLVAQAAEQVRLFAGNPAPLTAMAAALERHLRR